MEPNNVEDRSKNAVRWLVIAILLIVLLIVARHVQGQAPPLELTGGASSLIVLGPLSGQASAALEASVSGPVAQTFAWTAGARLGLGAWSSEAFGRFSAAPQLGAFLPRAGIELGLSARGDDDSGDKLLSEGRALSREELSPVYVAVHTAPLRFRIFDRYRLSVLELQLGTHVVPMGRFVRVQVGLVSLGVVL